MVEILVYPIGPVSTGYRVLALARWESLSDVANGNPADLLSYRTPDNLGDGASSILLSGNRPIGASRKSVGGPFMLVMQ